MMQERKQKGKILVFSSREICYLSSNFFANQIGAAFEELGYEVTVCELSKEDDLDAKLARYIGQPYRLILDFNSLLPRMVLDDGTPYVDRLAGPFFDYILDHPLFHYQGLSSGVKNLHAIVLDEAQQKYVEKYYEKVASRIAFSFWVISVWLSDFACRMAAISARQLSLRCASAPRLSSSEARRAAASCARCSSAAIWL